MSQLPRHARACGTMILLLFAACGSSGAQANGGAPDVQPALVDSLVRREFGGLVQADTMQVHPRFAVGDFDGDGRSDLVVIGRRAAAIPAGATTQPALRAYNPLGTGMKVEPSDNRISLDRVARLEGIVQLVIHDFRRNGESPRRPSVIVMLPARYESVLRVDRTPLRQAIAGDESEPIPPPALRGDAILLLHDSGEGAALYWDGERYRWYPYGG